MVDAKVEIIGPIQHTAVPEYNVLEQKNLFKSYCTGLEPLLIRAE
jgi:hypothetical protein